MAYLDKGRTISVVRRELNNLKQQVSPNLAPFIDTTSQNIITDCEEEYLYVTLEPLLRQRFVYHFAGYLHYADERKLYWLYMAIEPLMAHEQIDALLRKRFGAQYHAIKERVPRLGAILGRLNFHLNNFDEKKLRDGDIGTPAYNAVMDSLLKLPFIDDTLEKVLATVSIYTSVGQITVPNQALQIHQMRERKVQYQEERGARPAAQPQGEREA